MLRKTFAGSTFLIVTVFQFLLSSVLSKLNTFGLWAKQDIWEVILEFGKHWSTYFIFYGSNNQWINQEDDPQNNWHWR